MRIFDKHGNPHELRFDTEIFLDHHALTRALRTHNTLILHGFTVPHELRRRKIGSVALHAIERHYGAMSVTHFQIALHGCEDEEHAQFFAANGYTKTVKGFEKFEARH